MSKQTKGWLVTATVLLVLGSVIFIGVMTMLKWNFSKLTTSKYETNVHDVTDAFHSITVNTDVTHLQFAVSEDEVCHVECYEETKAKHSVSVENGALVIGVVNEKAWYDYVGIHSGTPKVTVYLPRREYTALTVTSHTGNVEVPQEFSFATVDVALTTGGLTVNAQVAERMSLKTSTGRVCVSGVACEGDVSVQVSTGKVILTDLTCRNLTTDGNTGSVMLTNVQVAENLSVKRTTGDVTFDRTDAAEITVTTDTGDVTGSLLSAKVFVTTTNTGDVCVPTTTEGGLCNIHTNTGDIELEVCR